MEVARCFLPWWTHTPTNQTSIWLGGKCVDPKPFTEVFVFWSPRSRVPLENIILSLKEREFCIKRFPQTTPMIIPEPKYLNIELETHNKITSNNFFFIIQLWFGDYNGGATYRYSATQVSEWIRKEVIFLGFWECVPWFGVCYPLYWGSPISFIESNIFYHR